MGSSFPSSGSSASEPSQEGSQPAERQLLPLTVWLCPDADRPASVQDPARGRLCFRHRYAVGRELARHLITTCTGPDDLVVDAYTCSDATLSAAAELGRWAMGCVTYPPLARHLGDRLRAGIPSPALGWVGIRPVAAECLASGLSDIAGKVRLIVAAPPELDLRRERSSQVARPPVSPGCQACQGQTRWISEGQLRSFLLGCRKILAPGGHLAVVTTARHASGRLVDPAPVIIRDAARLGLAYTQHVVAVRVPVAGNDLVVQAGPEELAQLRRPGSALPPPAARVHADVCLFTKPVTRERNGGGTR